MRLVAMAACAAVMIAGAGCRGVARHALFVTHQTVGVDLGGTPQSPDVTLGYKRTEFATVPVDPGQVDAAGNPVSPSMIATSLVRTGWWDGTRVAAVIGTGAAATKYAGQKGRN